MIDANMTNHKVLSEKEESVFEKLAKGMSYQAIAEETHRSEDTVKFHAKAIREKFHARSTLEAVAIAIAKGWLEIKEVGVKTTLAVALTLSAGVIDDDNDLLRAGRISRPTVSRNKEV